MERELEALASRPGSPTELPFQALVEAAGGRRQVLLVGELWEREQSRALLRDFARALFPPEPGDCKPEPGDYNPEPGDCNPESGDCKPEPGDCNPKSGDCKPEPGDCKPEPGDCKPEPEDYHPEHGDCKPEPGDCNPEPGDCKPEPEDCKPEPGDCKPEPGDCKPEPGDCKPEPGDCKPSCAEAEGAGTAATRPHWARGATSRAIRSPLVFVLCRASSLAAREPRRRLREMLRDVRGRRRAGAALVGVLVADVGFEDSVTPALRLLEALLRAVFRGQLGGPVQAAAYCPGHPASSRAIQAAACRALQAAGPGRPAEGAWERPGLPRLLACFPWGPWNQRKDGDATPSRGPAQEYLQVSEEEVALTAIFPNGDCEDCGSGSRTQDGVVHMSPEPTEDARFSGPLDCP